MPCDQVRTISIDFSKASKDVLKAAIENLGHRVTETAKGLSFYDRNGTFIGSWTKGGNLEMRQQWGGQILKEADVRTAYSGAAIAATSKKFAQWQTVKKAENKYVLRRAF